MIQSYCQRVIGNGRYKFYTGYFEENIELYFFENMIQSYFYSTNVSPLQSLCVKCDPKQNNEAVSVKLFSKLYYPQSELFVKYNICLKTLLQQGI